MSNFTFNNKYLMKNGEPWFPIMGEFHYSRFDKKYWKDSIYKMKSGGVDVVSSYVIWIHHEELEGEYDFAGNKDLRAFVKTCAECNQYLMLRIGPWCHGEVRNGGFPDWLLNKPLKARTNDEAYFREVEKFYQRIYTEVQGLFHKDGGPIIGIQIDNEFGHCGGLGGEEGEYHMRRLRQMAENIGFIVPIYTATGWGGAVTGGMLPVMGGYSDAPWDQRITEIEPSGNYIFTHERNDHNIGSDFGFGTGITFDINKFPYLTAELGGGLQVTRHRRTVATGKDIGAMSLVKLGSGVNLLGYYMYHGGTNPKGRLTTLQESKATGFINDLPILSYDFRAPLREYGQISDTYKELKLLTMFIKDFGTELCHMSADIPEDNPLYPTNLKDLRYSYRHDGEKGYLFINNYQRRRTMAAHDKVRLQLKLSKETISFPEFSVQNGDYFFYPFNMPIGKAIIKTALATPLCKLNIGEKNDRAVVFYTDGEPHYQIQGDLEDIKLINITREEAKNAWKVMLDKEYIIISNASVIQKEKDIDLIAKDDIELKVYPDLPRIPEGFEHLGTEGEFAVYKKTFLRPKVEAIAKEVGLEGKWKTYDVELRFLGESLETSELNDLFLNIDYAGEIANLYIDGEHRADNFYGGDGWEVSLKHLGYAQSLKLKIRKLKEGDKIFIEKWPDMKDGEAWDIVSIAITPEFSHKLMMK